VPLVTTDSIVLQTFVYGDTSRILRLLTRTHGVQSVIAKGALRPRSRYGGVLDAFTAGSATFYFRESRDLHTLASFELGWSPQRLGGDLIRFGGASLLAEIVLRTASEQPDPALFDALGTALRRIAEAGPARVEATALAHAWSIVDRLGFAPALDACIACGRALSPDEVTSFDYTAGGVRCGDCAPAHGGRPLPAAARQTLRRLAGGEAVELAGTAAHWRLLARYLSHHVVDEAPLRSLSFLADALAADGRLAADDA
jgi:DNA repair protein RecO (recombination protein O)